MIYDRSVEQMDALCTVSFATLHLRASHILLAAAEVRSTIGRIARDLREKINKYLVKFIVGVEKNCALPTTTLCGCMQNINPKKLTGRCNGPADDKGQLLSGMICVATSLQA